MIKLSKKVSDSLPKRPRQKTKQVMDNVGQAVETVQKRVRKKQNWRERKAKANLAGQPERDTFQSSKTATPPNTQQKEKSSDIQKGNIGEAYREAKMKHAMQYLKDLDAVAQEIPEASFFVDLNTEHVVKTIKSMLLKLAKREDKYRERGYKEVIRDEIRARMFLPNAQVDDNYQKIIKAMEKRGYKVADTMAEDVNGNLILDASGKPVKIKDIAVRYGENAQPSGYQDIQIRFKKNKELFELIIMPGPNYMQAADREHKIFDIFKLYDSQGMTRDIGAKQIVSGIKDQFGIVTRRLYSAAEQRDITGSAQVTEAVTFTPEGIKTLNGLFSSLKQLFLGKYKALPPSKRSAPTFKETQTSRNLGAIEQELRTYMDLYKPIENN